MLQHFIHSSNSEASHVRLLHGHNVRRTKFQACQHPASLVLTKRFQIGCEFPEPTSSAGDVEGQAALQGVKVSVVAARAGVEGGR